MKKYIFLFLLLFNLPTFAQQQTAEELFDLFKATSGFDRKYPREKVYLHMDNTSYVEGDTLWYKAYVVRASSLRPTDLSRVLYVELLNADGGLIEKQMLRLDSIGQADGCFSLKRPVMPGYYEVRAYTREMTNWDEPAIFSRVVPIFGFDGNNTQKQTSDLLHLSLPVPEKRKGVTIAMPRPYTMTDRKEYVLNFYPEGGSRAKGVEQYIAYQLTDGMGNGMNDTLQLCDDKGNVLSEFQPEYGGRGTFVLSAQQENGFVRIKNVSRNTFALPATAVSYALHAEPLTDGVNIKVQANDSAIAANSLLGLAVISREKVCYFDTLTVIPNGTEVFVPRKALRGGVNRIELFDVKGQSYSTRLIWMPITEEENKRVSVSMQQNKAFYEAFEPAVVKIQLKDAKQHPVQTVFSIAVRDISGNITNPNDGGVAADMLLSSEIKGYVAHPELYFVKDDAAHRRMLDLLLMVQGWTANHFSTMCGKTPFVLKQPIEEVPILRGTLYADNNRLHPLKNYNLKMLAYSLNGKTLQGNTCTDENGKFSFANFADFKGDYYMQFSIRSDKDHASWSRLAIDQWFAPRPRAFAASDLHLSIPMQKDSIIVYSKTDTPDTFQWTDTIPRTVPTILNEAKVSIKGKYRGFTGGRYTWNGGEHHGEDRAIKYYNVAQIVEQLKDSGKATPDLGELLPMLDHNFSVTRYGLYKSGGHFEEEDDKDAPEQYDPNSGGSAIFPESNTESDLFKKLPEALKKNLPPDEQRKVDAVTNKLYKRPRIEYKANYVTIYLNNVAWYEDGLLQYNDNIFNNLADNYRSICFVPNAQREDAVMGKDKLLSVANRYMLYIYEQPNLYRVKSVRGTERRLVQGFASHSEFYSPDYRRFDLPNPSDRRRTLYWNPSVKTDENGETNILFFTNSRLEQRLDISIRGVSTEGGWIEN